LLTLPPTANHNQVIFFRHLAMILFQITRYFG
jgi:hypothetical protein